MGRPRKHPPDPMADKREVVGMWTADWTLFARQALRAGLDPEQEAILRAVQTSPRVSVASGTARGKDYVAAVAALCFLFLTPRFDDEGHLTANTKVALTAPTGRQVLNIMMPEISRLYANLLAGGFGRPGWKLLKNGIQTDSTEWFLTGFKADEHNHEAWSGFHAVNTMFVVTEASGISEDIFSAIEGNLQGNSRILLVFNPNVPTGYAARSQKGDRWARFRLNSLTAPNVIQRRTVIPGQVDYGWVMDKIENWCTPITAGEAREELDDFEFEGRWYRPEDLFRTKVLGKFPKVGEDMLIPRQWIELAHERWREASGEDPGSNEPRVLGVDVAGMGRDNSCFVERHGDWVDRGFTHNSGGAADHMKVAGMVHERRKGSKRDIYVSVDTIGEGAGVYSRLLETDDPKYMISCKYSEAAKKDDRPLTDVTGQYTFLNMRAYLFWAIRDWLNPRNGSNAMLPSERPPHLRGVRRRDDSLRRGGQSGQGVPFGGAVPQGEQRAVRDVAAVGGEPKVSV